MVPTWCLLDGSPRAKDTEVTLEDHLPLPVVEWPTNTHLSKATNKAISNSRLVATITLKTSTTRVVSTTTGINKEATAHKIIAEAEAVVVTVEAEVVVTTTTKVEVDMVGTRK